MSEALPGHAGVQLEDFALVWSDNRPNAPAMLSGQCYQGCSRTRPNWPSCGVAFDDPAICNALVSNPVVSNPVVSNPVVSNPVVSNPVVSNPVVSDAIVRSPAGRDTVICDPTAGRGCEQVIYRDAQDGGDVIQSADRRSALAGLDLRDVARGHVDRPRETAQVETTPQAFLPDPLAYRRVWPLRH